MPRGKPESTIEERFLARKVEVDCINPGMSQCWIWIGAKSTNAQAYGRVTPQTYGTTMAHQWACHHWNGSPLPVEKGMCVKHKCDTHLCVNPAHLEYGTLQENIKEMIDRNPAAMGRIVPTEQELTLLKEMIEQNVPRRVKAQRLGHSRHWVDRITRDYLPSPSSALSS